MPGQDKRPPLIEMLEVIIKRRDTVSGRDDPDRFLLLLYGGQCQYIGSVCLPVIRRVDIAHRKKRRRLPVESPCAPLSIEG